MRRGRGRIYAAFAGKESELSFLAELHARAADLVADLPDEAWAAERHDCSIRQLWEHMIQAELGWISRVAGIEQQQTVPRCDELAGLTRRALADLDLGSEISVGPFTCVGQVLRHLQWHWAHHSAQINLLRKALGYEYEWTFQ